MQSNYKNINVPLPIKVYNKLRAYMKLMGIATNLSFIENALKEAPHVFFEFIELDGRSKTEISAIFQLGQCIYRWTGESFRLLSEGDAHKLIFERGV